MSPACQCADVGCLDQALSGAAAVDRSGPGRSQQYGRADCPDAAVSGAIRSRYGPDTIRALLADREFIGLEWLNFLAATGIPFAIRVKQGQLVITPEGKVLTLATLLARCRGRCRDRMPLCRQLSSRTGTPQLTPRLPAALCRPPDQRR